MNKNTVFEHKCPHCREVFYDIYPASVVRVLEAAKNLMDYPPVEFEEEYTEYSILFNELKAAVRAWEEEEATDEDNQENH